MAEEIANVEAAEAWDAEAEHWAVHADQYDAGIRPQEARLLAAAALGAADRVLDVGCGAGGTSLEAATRVPDGHVLGVDLAERLVERARERAAERGLTNVEFLRADAQVHDLRAEPFDVLVSRFGGMFFADPVAAYRNLARALVPGGRLALLVWQELDDNEWIGAVRGALAMGRDLPSPPPRVPGPFAFADPEYTTAVLGDAGFAEVAIDDVRDPMTIGPSAAAAFDFLSTAGVVQGLLHDLDEPTRAAALAELRRSFEAHDGPDGVQLPAAAWLVTARRSS